MNGRGKSDDSVVPTKPPNKAASAAAEEVEERESTKGNASQQNASRTQSRTNDAPSALDRVRKAAIGNKKQKFTALFHHLTIERLRAAFFALGRSASAGVDGVTWKQYRECLEDNLSELHRQLHQGAYRAKPSRRVFIPKADGRERPLGIASLQDKIVQRAVVEILNAIYEADFLGFSYGFRPGRGQHDALDALAVGLCYRKVSWVLDADIRGFFDAIDHGWLLRFVKHRIADNRIIRLIQKWLRAGVLHEGKTTVQEVGSPQGATVSPLLANIFLHYVFDLWANQWRNRHARGDVVIVRYADDVVVGFQHLSDARRFRAAMSDRLNAFGLELHPDKTRMVRFGRFASRDARTAGERGPGTFEFLGFTHYGSNGKTGSFRVMRRTSKRRMRATLKALKDKLMKNRHEPIPKQGAWLRRVLQGYFQYHAVYGNGHLLDGFRGQVIGSWLHALRRRSQRHRMTWKRMNTLVRRWIPSVRIVHPWPNERFFAKHPR